MNREMAVYLVKKVAGYKIYMLKIKQELIVIYN